MPRPEERAKKGLLRQYTNTLWLGGGSSSNLEGPAVMGPGLPLLRSLLLSDCSRYLQLRLPRNIFYPQSQLRFFNSVPTGGAAAATGAQPGGQQPTVSDVFPLPRTKVYEHTRPQPRAPVRHRSPRVEFKVNDDQTVLDDMYAKLFGRGLQGAELLPPELRWQAVTHISFDHGRQPYNNKLAFLGRRILFFYANAYILNQPLSPTIKTSSSPSPEAISELELEPVPESEGPAREAPVSTVSSETNTYLTPTPFEHPDYKSIDTATYDNIGRWTDEVELAKIARASGLYQVMRWKPTNPGNLVQSGMDTVAVECLHAIIGAIALSNGGVEAKKFVIRLLEQSVQ